MDQPERSYIPAAGQHWLLRLYDPLLWILRGDALKRPLIEQAAITPGFRVLDVGCGTGSLTVLIKRLHPQAAVVGLDPDDKALAIAKRKVERAGLSVEFDRGFADRLAYPDASFDRVFSSFMFHHLTRDEKSATLGEIRRVLKVGGSLHLLDFAPPRSFLSRVVGHLFHQAAHVEDNVAGRIPSLIAEAGLVDCEEVAHRNTLVGSIAYYRAVTIEGSP
ncbi:MAG: class I SAM-dependent methyltransferase [Deltaproteobacteria bacterium]|nr:class I SAM-dependent methyltransferase [Deltaproteobacteria bacterium]MBI3389148.1 class I SAM-dependent methyltransferase [Deltaproteobacteria bacterium]